LCCNAFVYAQEERVPAQSQPFNEETWRNAVMKMNDYQDNETRKAFEPQQKRMNIKDK
jgi:hypothetical protein